MELGGYHVHFVSIAPLLSTIPEQSCMLSLPYIRINNSLSEVCVLLNFIVINPFMPTVPTFAVRETQSLRQQMLELGCENATVGKNGLTRSYNMLTTNSCLSWGNILSQYT